MNINANCFWNTTQNVNVCMLTASRHSILSIDSNIEPEINERNLKTLFEVVIYNCKIGNVKVWQAKGGYTIVNVIHEK